MREFFYPSSIAVFGVSEHPRNLARNIITNCRNFGFTGRIYTVGKHPGTIDGHKITCSIGVVLTIKVYMNVITICRYGITINISRRTTRANTIII